MTYGTTCLHRSPTLKSRSAISLLVAEHPRLLLLLSVHVVIHTHVAVSWIVQYARSSLELPILTHKPTCGQDSLSLGVLVHAMPTSSATTANQFHPSILHPSFHVRPALKALCPVHVFLLLTRRCGHRQAATASHGCCPHRRHATTHAQTLQHKRRHQAHTQVREGVTHQEACVASHVTGLHTSKQVARCDFMHDREFAWLGHAFRSHQVVPVDAPSGFKICQGYLWLKGSNRQSH